MNRDLPISEIHARSDARTINPEAVAALVESIGSVGLINPIRVRGKEGDWEVIAGVHRLEAHKALGLVEISANIVDDDDLHAELGMIDENLCRHDLTPVDRARNTARRRVIYQELYPETKQGGDHKSSNYQNGEFDRRDGFIEQTAKATGSSPQSVYREASRGDNIIPEVMDLIRGTKLDTGSYLDKTKKLPPNDQFKAVQRDLLNLRALDRNKGVKLSAAPVSAEMASEKRLADIMKRWNLLSSSERAKFLEMIGE